MSAHTPAPWDIQEAEDDGVVIFGEDGLEIARMSEDREEKECEANARLIASAPELLRRLKLHNQFYPDPDDAALIAKAEGLE